MKTTWFLCLIALSLFAAAGPAAQSKANLVTVTSKLEDEVAYLRAKTRRGLPISAEEYRVLEQRLDRFMARIGLAFDRAVRGEIPAGVDLDARLLSRLSSGDAEVEGGVEATTLVDLRHDDVVLMGALERSGPDGASACDSAGQALDPGVVTGGVVPGLTHAPWSALAGTAGTFRSAQGHDVALTPGTILRLRFDAPLTLQ